MRQGANSRRSRGRNNRKQNVPLKMQTFDSNGPDVRIRGNAYQVFEKYLQLARDAVSSGDRVAAENYYQHAEHYFRIINADGDRTGAQQNGNMRGHRVLSVADVAEPDDEGSDSLPQGSTHQPMTQQPMGPIGMAQTMGGSGVAANGSPMDMTQDDDLDDEDDDEQPPAQTHMQGRGRNARGRGRRPGQGGYGQGNSGHDGRPAEARGQDSRSAQQRGGEQRSGEPRGNEPRIQQPRVQQPRTQQPRGSNENRGTAEAVTGELPLAAPAPVRATGDNGQREAPREGGVAPKSGNPIGPDAGEADTAPADRPARARRTGTRSPARRSAKQETETESLEPAPAD